MDNEEILRKVWEELESIQRLVDETEDKVLSDKVFDLRYFISTYSHENYYLGGKENERL